MTGNFRRSRLILKRNPRVFLPTPRGQVIVPFKPLSLIAIVLLLGLSIFLGLRSDLLLVRHLDFSQPPNFDQCAQEDEITKALDVLGRSIIFLDLGRRKMSLLDKYLCLSYVQLEKKYPNGLKVNLALRNPLLQIAYFEQESPEATKESKFPQATLSASASASLAAKRYFIVDDAGFTYRDLDRDAGLLTVASSKRPLLGQQLPPKREGRVVDFVQNLKSSPVFPERIFLDKDDFFVAFFPNDIRVLVPFAKDQKETAQALQKILEEVKIENKQLSEIDLRFDKPIAKFR